MLRGICILQRATHAACDFEGHTCYNSRMHRVVPELIVENYKAGRFSGTFPAVGMFLDLSGFSAMTDALMTHGQHGAEILANLMHGVFDPLVEGIFDHGGKIVGFAGDGIMALFPVESEARTTAFSALAAAWLIQKRLFNDPVRNTIYGKFQFTAKIGLTYGDVTWGILHSEDRRNATYFFRGSAVDDAALAEHNARAGQIVLTSSMEELLRESIETECFGSFYHVNGFAVDLPAPSPIVFPPVNLEISRIFMPEEIIAQNARGEFRQVVNLFIRFPNLRDDELQQVTQIIFDLRRKYGGLLNRIDFGDKGCNILMLWGAPVAYENDITRALNFILDLQERVHFAVTAGVTYYVAHAGYLGSVMCEDYTCYGWGVNLASRFMMNAPDGAIWVDDRIARRISNRFELEYVGEQQFKGFSLFQKVHRLRRYDFGIESVYQGELIGRENELAQLEDFVKPLWRGEFAGVHLILGDAGIGKGRLVQAFRSSQLFNSRPVLWAFCQSEQILRQSFNPFRSWLVRYFGLASIYDVQARKQIFDSRLNDLVASVPDPALGHEVDRLRSVLGALVDLYWENSLYEQLDAEARYNSTLLALLSLIKVESLRQPVILFVEDVQFIDEDSLQFLPRLKRSIQSGDVSYPIAIIATSRIESHNPVLESELVDTQLRLAGLVREAAARLVEVLLGGVPSLDLVNLVMNRSEGNPFFIEQIVRYLQEEKLIEMSARGWTHVRHVRESFLPGDIGALLVARLDQLSRKVKETVQTASVLGREFQLAVLAEMTAEAAALEQCVLDAEQSAIWVGDETRHYVFTHGLLRDAAYTMQMRAHRKELHFLAFAALERIYAENLRFHYAELAHHSEQAELREKALHYYTLAGKSASAAYQNSKGVEYFTGALALCPPDDLAARFDLLCERIDLLNRMGKSDLHFDDLNSLDALAKQIGSEVYMSKALMLFTNYYYFIGSYSEGIESARQAFAMPGHTSEPEVSFLARIACFLCMLRLGRLEDAMASALETLELARAAGDRRQLGRVLAQVGFVAFEQREPAAGREYFSEALQIANELMDRKLQARVFNNLAVFEAGVTCDYAKAQTYYRKALDVAREIGDRSTESTAFGNLGFVAGLQGNFAEAEEYLARALASTRESGDLYSEIFLLVNLSSNAGIQNQAPLAFQYAEQAIVLAERVGDKSGQAWGWMYLGYAQLSMDKVAEAQMSFEKSVRIREGLGQTALLMEPMAGLVEVGLRAENDDLSAHNTERILVHLQSGGTLNGTDEPLRVYHSCYQFLEKKQDPRSARILQDATQMLEAQLARLKDDRSRQMYIENVPWRLALRNAASKSL